MVEEVLNNIFVFPLRLEYILGQKQKAEVNDDVASAAEEIFNV